MPAAKTDNIDLKRGVHLDDRTGKIVAGAWSFFADIADANAKTSIQNYKYLGLTIPLVSNGVTVEFWLRDDLNTWRRKSQYVGRFDDTTALHAAFAGNDPVANPATTPEQSLLALVGVIGTPLIYYVYDGLNNAWIPTGTPVVNTLAGDEIGSAPSVHAVNVALSTVLGITPAEAATMTAGVTYFLSALKSGSDGSISLDTSVQSINIFAPSTVDVYLLATTGWGGVAGQNSEYKQLTGDNRTGALGRSGQVRIINGVNYTCQSAVLGTTSGNGNAIWVRNRSVNFLDSTDTVNDGPLITVLKTSPDWNSDQYLAVTYKSTPGVIYCEGTGYKYTCIDTYAWRREGVAQAGKPAQITTTTHANLTSHLTAHDFTTGNYIEGSSTTGGADESNTTAGQEYWPSGSSVIYRRGLTSQGWMKLKINEA